MKPVEKTVPFRIDAERALLGCILYNPNCLPAVAETIQPGDFYRDAHRIIYEAMLELDRDNKPIDTIMLGDLFEERGQTESIGGMFYVTGLHDDVPMFAVPEEYAAIVSDTSRRRRLIYLASEIAALGFEEKNAELAIAKSEEKLRALALGKRTGHAEDVSAITAEYIDHLDRMQRQRQRGVIVGVPSGFQDLDRMTGGFQKSDLITLAARPGRGKTALALTIAKQVMHFCGEMGYRTLMFSLEMSKWQLAQRLLSMESGVNQSQLRSSWLDHDEWETLVKAQDEIPSGRLWVDDQAGLSIQEIRSRARRHQAEHGLDFVIADYMQLMTAQKDDGSDYQNRVEEVDKISQGLKNLARELDIPVLALAQLSRKVEERSEKIPQLSDLRESGGIEQNSDIVMFLYENPAHAPTEQGRVIDLIIAKHRQGEVGTVPLFFRPHLTKFESVSVTVTEEPPEPPPATPAPKQIARTGQGRAWNDGRQ